MKVNSGNLIRRMRKDMGMSQEELADRLYISTRQLSRIETGESDMDVWQFVTVLELLGQPTEDFWLLYLDSAEYDEYRTYRNVKRLLRERRYPEARDAITELEKKGLSKRPFISQFLIYAKVKVSREMSPKEALEELYRAMHMSRPDFDEKSVIEYRMTYNEIHIACEIANNLDNLGEIDRAEAFYKGMIASRENIRASEEDKAALLPAVMFNLSTILGKSGKLKEALKLCNQALEL